MARPSSIQSIQSTNDQFHRFMLHGDPGVGKTVLASSAPKCLMLVNDPGETLSAKAHGSKADRWVIDDYVELDEAIEYLRHEGHAEYEWVWVDNVTLLGDQNMDAIMKALVEATEGKRNQWVPDQAQYLQNQNRLGATVRQLLTLPMHIGLVAHSMTIFDEDSESNLVVPMIQGGQGDLSKKICGYMNMVGYLRQFRKEGEIQRSLLLEKRSKYLAKGRYPGMQGEMRNPTMPLLLKAAEASVPGAARRPAKKSVAKRSSTQTRSVK